MNLPLLIKLLKLSYEFSMIEKIWHNIIRGNILNPGQGRREYVFNAEVKSSRKADCVSAMGKLWRVR